MKTVTICVDLLNPESWQSTDVPDVCDFLTTQWKTFPATGRLYHNHFSDANDVTPHCLADIARLQTLEGAFFVVVYPEDPLTIMVIVAIALAAVAIGLAFLLRPTTPVTPEQSPNNQLSDRQNKARPNERIPDIVGTVRSTLDLIAVPYRTFFQNREFEVTYMCASRGSLTILDCLDGDTPVDWIDGEYVAVYGPDTSPNGTAPGESTPQATFGVNPLPSLPLVVSVQPSTAINGQRLRPPNFGNLNTLGNVRFNYPDSIETNGADNIDFTDYFVASTVLMPQYLNIYNDDAYGANASDPGGVIHSVAITGRYQIVSVSSTSVVLSAPGGGAPSTVNSNWNVVNTFVGAVSTYAHGFSITGEGSVWVGPIIMQIADLSEVWFNFVSKGGLYYVDNKGNQHGYTFTVQVGVQSVDANGNPIGNEIFGTVDIIGSGVDRTDVGSTLKFTAPAIGAVQCRAQLLTPMPTDTRNVYCDQIQWRDMFGVSPVAATNFGNVTTAICVTTPTQAALSVKERKINMLVTRNIPTWNNRNGSSFNVMTGQVAPTFSSTLYPSNNAADILCFLALDPYIGRRSLPEVNVPSIYAVADSGYMGLGRQDGSIAAYFGTFLATEFCATFDNSNTSFEESAAQLAQAINCIAYRRGSSLALSFEAQTSNSTILYNHRNKIPDSETRTVTFGTLNNNDGIEYDYIDPNAPNYPNIDTTVTLYFPVDQSAQNPKKVKSVGVRNHTQAMLNGWRLYQKLLYQNSQTEFEATQEAALSILYQRILVADNTRSDTQDGEIEGQTALLLYTSQPLTFTPGQTYTAFLQHYDQTVEAMPVTAGPIPNSMLLATAPRLPLVYDKTMFAQTTYILVGSAPTRSNAFLLADKEPQQNGTYKLTAVNYDDRYYSHDTDVSTGVVVPVAYGYAPQGYTGSGVIGIAGSPMTIARSTPFNSTTYNASSLFTQNNVASPVTLALATYGGSVPVPAIRTVTVTGIITLDDGIIRANATSAAIVLTLPPSPIDGQVVVVKKIDSSTNTVTIGGNGNNIDGAATQVISAQYAVLRLEFDLGSLTWGIY